MRFTKRRIARLFVSRETSPNEIGLPKRDALCERRLDRVFVSRETGPKKTTKTGWPVFRLEGCGAPASHGVWACYGDDGRFGLFLKAPES